MKIEVFKASAFSALRSAIASIIFTLAVMGTIIYGLGQVEQSNRSEGRRRLDESLRRAAVTCYAIEGSYPDSVSYIEEHYGVIVDTTKYAVYYEIFASNILPEITVIELK